MSILNGFKTFERYLKTPDGYQLYSERQLAKDVLMGDGKDSNNNIENNFNEMIHDITQLSNPNLLINGDFQVNQRGQDSYTNNGTTRMYTVDRWCIGNGATLGVNNGYIQVSTTRDGYLLQSLETAVNGVHTLSLYVKDVSGVVSVYFSGVESGVKTEKTLEVGLNVLTVEDNNIKEVVIEFKESNSSVSIEWVKLEKGSIATPLIPRQYAEELALCERYFQLLFLPQCPAIGDNKTLFGGSVYHVKMRTSPTYDYQIFDTQNQEITSDVSVISLDSVHVLAIVTKNPHTSICGVVILDAEIYWEV